MNILAVDSSALTATVAVIKDDLCVGELSFTTTLTHSETIMPMIDEVLKKTSLSIKDIDLFACSNGPGSFTGLRIGVGTIKGLAYGLGKNVCAVSTLEALAHNVPYSEYLVAPIMDARRGEVYNAIYRFKDGILSEMVPPRALPVSELCASLSEKTVFVGDGVKVHREKIKELMGDTALFAPAQHCLQRAASVAAAARTKEPIPPHELSVLYLRKPQAERERDEKLKG